MNIERVGNPITESKRYLQTLTLARDWYESRGLQPIFVGGVIAKTLNLASIQQSCINHKERTITIPVDKNTYTLRRKDGTFDDFDIIVQHPSQDHVQTTIKELEQHLHKEELDDHFVSTEAVRYDHWNPKRNKLTQMVSGLEVTDNLLRFTFGELSSDPIPQATMERWTYDFVDNGLSFLSLPSLNPAFFGFRYLMRLPLSQTGGLRAKDRVTKIDENTNKSTNKIHTLMKLREKALLTGAEQGIVYDQSAWQDFIIKLQKPQYHDPITHMKSELMNLWWNQLGFLSTAIAHGEGVFKQVAKLGNKFVG
ncbi:hypothetical protein GYA28_01245 [Candidatus Roizmanbacteria bacterium]|jgi:hypothetical protein|nr:hypothetical protein [Candidatus Roizmanbacteria bacterium]